MSLTSVWEKVPISKKKSIDFKSHLDHLDYTDGSISKRLRVSEDIIDALPHSDSNKESKKLW